MKKNINIKQFLELKIPIPTIDIQNKIIEIMDDLYDKVELNKNSIEKYEKMFLKLVESGS